MAKRGRPRKSEEEKQLTKVKKYTKDIINNLQKRDKAASRSGYYTAEVAKYESGSYQKIDMKDAEGFRKFVAEREATGVDKSVDLFEKAIDKWPL